MIIQGLGGAAAAYAAMKTVSAQRQTFPSSPVNNADRVSISDAAKAMASASKSSAEEQSIQVRLDAIKAKPAVERTTEDTEFLHKNDKRLNDILAKDEKTRTAEEVDYLQKAGGFVNTMAELSPKEKALYDELIAKGNWEAASGLQLVGMARSGMSGQQVRLPNGQVFDPLTTEVTANNIRTLFKQMFVGDNAETNRLFDALASYLDQPGAADGSTGNA